MPAIRKRKFPLRREGVKTGGGSAPLQLTELQEKIIGIIGRLSRGVPGGTFWDITLDNICSGSTPSRSHLPSKDINVTNVEI